MRRCREVVEAEGRGAPTDGAARRRHTRPVVDGRSRVVALRV